MDYTTCKYRLYPTDEQQRQFAHIFGCCRFIKNLILEQNEFTHELGFGFTNATKLSREIKELRDDGEIAPWLKNAPAQVLQQAMRDRLEGFSRFFKGQAAYPRYVKRTGQQGFRIPQNVKTKRVSARWGEILVPKCGSVRFRWDHSPKGLIKAATASKTLMVATTCVCAAKSERALPNKEN